MAEPPDPETEALIDSALRRAVRADGPVRLYRGKHSEEGLFSGRTGPDGAAARHGLETSPALWAEEPRAHSNALLFVRLLPGGLTRLVEITKPEQRGDLIDGASPLYRQRLLETWADLAAARSWRDDFPRIAESCAEMIRSLHRILPEGSELSLPGAQEGQERTLPTANRHENADFKRRMAHELVVAWKYAPTPEAKQSIANALKNSGVKQIGEPRERLILDGGLHRCDEPAFPGDEVEVVESGWLVHDGIGEYLLEKAIVKLI